MDREPLVTPIALGPSGGGWLACLQEHDGTLTFAPVVSWALCRISWWEPDKSKPHGGDYQPDPDGNQVRGVVVLSHGVAPVGPEDGLLGYMRAGESPEDQPWWRDVLAKRGA